LKTIFGIYPGSRAQCILILSVSIARYLILALTILAS
jgi:hypothetical protein